MSRPSTAEATPGETRRTRRLAVLGSRDNEATADLVDTWRAHGVDVSLVGPAELAALGPGDTVLGRIDVLPTLDGVEPGLLALLLCERRGVRVLNRATALLAAHDKLRTARLLRAAGLPHPRSVLVRDRAHVPDVPLPAVVKPRFGSWGRHVFWCDTASQLDDVLEQVEGATWFRRHGALVQEALPNPGRDARLVLVDGELVGSAERFAAPGEWRTNVSLGGHLRYFEPPAELVDLARAAQRVVGLDLGGVDLLPLFDGSYVVLEVNGAVEFDEDCARADRNVYLDVGRALGVAA